MPMESPDSRAHHWFAKQAVSVGRAITCMGTGHTHREPLGNGQYEGRFSVGQIDYR